MKILKFLTICFLLLAFGCGKSNPIQPKDEDEDGEGWWTNEVLEKQLDYVKGEYLTDDYQLILTEPCNK